MPFAKNYSFLNKNLKGHVHLFSIQAHWNQILCPVTKSEIPPGVYKVLLELIFKNLVFTKFPDDPETCPTYYMFGTTELDKPIFQKLRDILQDNWPILLKTTSVRKAKERLDTCSNYRNYRVMITKCNVWSGLDPELEKKKTNK